MLSRFDDYPIHPTPEPIAHRTTSDPNTYDRLILIGPHQRYRLSGLVDGARA